MASNEFHAALRQRLGEVIDAARSLEQAVGAFLSTAMGSADGTEPEAAGAPAADRAGDGAPGPSPLNDAQRLVCERVINAFETGTAQGRYGAISIYEDGPHDIKQITYGRSQTTEYGNLRELVGMYVEAGGSFSDDLRGYVPRIGRAALVDDARFKDLLKRAGNEDPVMREVQDRFFDRRYFQPALSWANANGFSRALSMLVIYDSFIQSGGILDLLRSRFPERPPARGGDELTWTSQYVEVRHAWLSGHRRPAVRASAYRTRDLRREVGRDNWDLDILPISANGVAVNARPSDDAGPGLDDAMPYDVPFLGVGVDPGETAEPIEEVWSELEGVPSDIGLAAPDRLAAGSSTSELASELLRRPGVDLADSHASGMRDKATARHNLEDAARGLPARRSSYGNAPGGAVGLDGRMLDALVALSDEHTFSISELAGGEHNPNSRHYAGVAVDFNVVDGRPVRLSHPGVAAFRTRCRALGATEVLGPGDRGHSTHVHAAWPRPS